MGVPALLVLDFDGVVCDGRPEYFETAWRAYVATWPEPLTRVRPDPVDWLACHRFYPGVPARLVALLEGPTAAVIVTTKTERFARALLRGADPRLSAMTVIGREPGQPVPKPAILRRLADRHGLGADAAGMWFVEDMLETLEATAARADVAGVRLFLADWGYNTPADRARVGGRIALLSLQRFAAPLETWPS